MHLHKWNLQDDLETYICERENCRIPHWSTTCTWVRPAKSFKDVLHVTRKISIYIPNGLLGNTKTLVPLLASLIERANWRNLFVTDDNYVKRSFRIERKRGFQFSAKWMKLVCLSNHVIKLATKNNNSNLDATQRWIQLVLNFVTVLFRMEQLMKDGTKRKLCFVETGKKKLSLSPSRRNLTISVQQGENLLYYCSVLRGK